jgi:hypothetical protein
LARIDVDVTDRETGAPLPGAHVGVFLLGPELPTGGNRSVVALQGTSDDRGRSTLEARLAPGECVDVWTAVRARGHAEWRPPRRRRPDGGNTVALPSLSEREPVALQVALARGTTLEGRVRDRSGRFVRGAHIGLVLADPRGCSWPHSAWFSETAHWPPSVRTDAHGRFEWLSFPVEWTQGREDAHYVLYASHDTYAPAMVHRVESLPRDSAGVIDIEVVVDEGVRLVGDVLGPDGGPLRGATVKATASPLADQPFCLHFDQTSKTDEAGRFTLGGLPRRAHRVEVQASGCAPFSRDVDLAAPDPEPLSFRLSAGGDVVGRVLGRDGEPLPSLHVFVSMEDPRLFLRTMTGERGEFRLEGLPASGRAKVRVNMVAEVEVDLPSPPLTLRAPVLAELSVLLVAEETGEPLDEEGWVSAFGPGFSTVLERKAGGRHQLPALPAGRYELWVDLPTRAPAVARVVLREDGPTPPVVVRVPRGGAIRGHVRTTDGRPVADARVSGFGPRMMHPRTSATDGSGAYEVRGLGEEAWLVFSSPGFALRAIPVRGTGTSESPMTVDAILGPGAVVCGRVTHRDGTPGARAHVGLGLPDLRHVPYPLPATLADERGEYVLRGVPEGDFVVVSESARARIRSTHGATLEVDLRGE